MLDPHDFKQIDDIVDARKKLGQYNVNKPSPAINYRYAYSSPSTADKYIRFDDTAMFVNEGDYLNNRCELKATDSEITVVRIRCDGLSLKRRPSKWDLHDIAVPGDGSHLGESPSMVNLATLVQQNDEYLVPLSSWDPYYNKNDGGNRAESYLSDDHNVECPDEDSAISSLSTSQSSANTEVKGPRGLARKISKFFRTHLRKTKTLPVNQVYQPPQN